jgi:hypothetical protein
MLHGARWCCSETRSIASVASAPDRCIVSAHCHIHAHGEPEADNVATQERAGESSAVTELHSGVPPPSHEMHEAARRSSGRATSSQGTSTLIHAATSRQAPPVKAASPVRTFFDPWNSSSTGHQRAENRLSGSTSWRASRNLKLGAQYKGGLGGGGGRVADTVGAGSEHFGQDGTKPNGGWEEGARGLRTGGRQSLTELWSATKAGKKPAREKHHEQPGLETEEEAVARHTRERSGQDEGLSRHQAACCSAA